MKKQKHWPINWVDGMKINKSHFQALENQIIDRFQNSNGLALHDYNFGLIPVSTPGETSLETNISSERVEISRCIAICRDGEMIEIQNGEDDSLARPMSELMGDNSFSSADEWFIVLRVNSFDRLPFGEPDPTELPLRHPFAAPKYHLEILPASQVTNTQLFHSAIPLARIVNSFQGREQDRNYIPPCTQVNAHHSLLDQHLRFAEKMLNIEGNVFEIIKKIQAKNKNNQGNQLTADIMQVALCLSDYISANYDHYRIRLPYSPPIDMVLWFMSLARILKSKMRILENQDSMLKYFDYYIKGADPTAFLTIIEELCNHHFSQLDIQSSLNRIERFLTFLDQLFNSLKDRSYQEFGNPSIIRKSGKSITSTSSSTSSIVVKKRSNSNSPAPDQNRDEGPGDWNLND